MLPTFPQLASIYERTALGSPLRRAVIHAYIQSLPTPDFEHKLHEYPREFVTEMAVEAFRTLEEEEVRGKLEDKMKFHEPEDDTA